MNDMYKNNSHIAESILDDPQDTLCPDVWNIEHGVPRLTDEAQRKIDDMIMWVQDQYHFNNLSVYIIGSICSNSYSSNSDIDIDFCAPGATKDDSNEDVVKEFGWAFKKNFIDNYANAKPEEAKIGSHPFEVYFSINPFQCFMSVGCYNVLERRWEVGPELKQKGFDPISKYYSAAMKQVDRILKDIRTQIFELYELAFVCKKSHDFEFKNKTFEDIIQKLEDISKLFKTMKNVRANFQKPCKSKEEALKRRKDKKQHVVDAAFKLLEKFGYIQIMRDVIKLYDDKNSGAKLSQSYIVDQILASIKANMSLKHLQDSEDAVDKQFLSMLQEVDVLAEDASSLVKMSFIAALMAVSSFIPANALTKSLEKAHKQDKHLNVNSPATKKAIAAAAVDNSIIGPMSKTNVVNAVAKLLWLEARGESEAGRKAIASVILNRTGNDPAFIVDVIKQPAAFSCMAGYDGDWTDDSYRWYLPWKAISGNKANKAIWDNCNDIALKLVDKKLKSTIGNRNAYLNKSTADKKAVDTWGKKCDLKVDSHHFGYLKENDPKYVVPGTFTSWKKHNAMQRTKTVIVKKGETLSKIAKDNNTTIAKILKLNKDIKNPNAISVGQKVRVA